MDFYNAMNKVINDEKSLTENGAVSYKSSGKELLDFNFSVTAMRNSPEEVIQTKYAKVYYESPWIAIKYLFYLGDIRGGLGERRTFNICMDWLADNQPDIVMGLCEFIPEYTRWDNLIRLVEHKECGVYIGSIIKDNFENDMKKYAKGEPISLMAKWLPSENASSAKTKALAKKMTKILWGSPKAYRQALSKLRKYLDVVETKMCANEWFEIDYEKVPSKANLIYSHAFKKHDPERRDKYIESVGAGKTKINAGVLQPHELIARYVETHCVGCSPKITLDETIEELWKALPNLSIENTLVVRDGSGSMTCRVSRSSESTCLEVATALAIYMAEHNSGLWKDKFITFSNTPKIVDLKNCQTLKDKMLRTYAEVDYSNTDIYKTMMLVLNTAKQNHLSQEEMPNTIVICSDMQFDGQMFHYNKTLFETIADEYKECGYKLPRICFWNICSYDAQTIPMQENELGLILCSGFSVQTLKMFMSGKLEPYEVLLEQINSERYDAIEKTLRDIY